MAINCIELWLSRSHRLWGIMVCKPLSLFWFALMENFLLPTTLLVALETVLLVPCRLRCFITFGTSKRADSWGFFSTWFYFGMVLSVHMLTATTLPLPPFLSQIYVHRLPCVGLLKLWCLVVTDVAISWLYRDVAHLCIVFWICSCRRHPSWEISIHLVVLAFKSVWISDYSSLNKTICRTYNLYFTQRSRNTCSLP